MLNSMYDYANDLRKEIARLRSERESMSMLVGLLLVRLGGEVTLTDAEEMEFPRDAAISWKHDQINHTYTYHVEVKK